MALKLFYCYAHEDKGLRTLLEKHLASLKQSDLISDWSDRNINAGQEWAKEIDTRLNTADIILLLISPDFLASEYCSSKEMKRALERHENESAYVIPIILRPVDFEGTPFSKLLALPTDAIPVRHPKWHTRDEAFVDIAQGKRKIVKSLLSKQSLNEADIHCYRQQYERALESYEKAIHFDPTNALAYVGLGNALLQIALKENSKPIRFETYDKAIKAFDKAIELDSFIASAYVGKGKALFGIVQKPENTVEFSDILDAFSLAMILDDKNEAVYIAQAEALRYLGKNAEALEAYKSETFLVLQALLGTLLHASSCKQHVVLKQDGRYK
jgi:tetratricopeptide (TPR) repeat protein